MGITVKIHRTEKSGVQTAFSQPTQVAVGPSCVPLLICIAKRWQHSLTYVPLRKLPLSPQIQTNTYNFNPDAMHIGGAFSCLTCGGSRPGRWPQRWPRRDGAAAWARCPKQQHRPPPSQEERAEIISHSPGHPQRCLGETITKMLMKRRFLALPPPAQCSPQLAPAHPLLVRAPRQNSSRKTQRKCSVLIVAFPKMINLPCDSIHLLLFPYPSPVSCLTLLSWLACAPAKAQLPRDPPAGIAAGLPSALALCKQNHPSFAFCKSDAKICSAIPMKTGGTKRNGDLQGNSDLQSRSWHLYTGKSWR